MTMYYTRSQEERKAQVWMVRWGEKGFSCKECRLAGGNTTRENEECMERTCDFVIVLS